MSRILPWLMRIEIDVRNDVYLTPENGRRLVEYLNRSLEIFKCIDADGDGNQELCIDHSRRLRQLLRDINSD